MPEALAGATFEALLGVADITLGLLMLGVKGEGLTEATQRLYVLLRLVIAQASVEGHADLHLFEQRAGQSVGGIEGVRPAQVGEGLCGAMALQMLLPLPGILLGQHVPRLPEAG